MGRLFLDGNEAIARAAVAAGCRFFAGYPITPATSIYQKMLELLPPLGGICLQGEDEIASIGFCLGAAMAGMKAMTATSGPGISLYSEHISLAIGAEIPLVIVDVQRLGPSTGSPTRGADGDIGFLRFPSSGGLPPIVLVPEDAADCYRLTMQAFNMAERLRCPVFIASNREVGQTREAVELSRLDLPQVVARTPAPSSFSGPSLAPLPDRPVPPFFAIGGKELARVTSSTHGEDGYITTDPLVIEKMLGRLRDKIHSERNTLALWASDLREDDDTLLIVYGVTARAAREAVGVLRAHGQAIGLLVLKTLYPVPVELLRAKMQGRRRVVVVEMNQGQYVREIERLAGGCPVHFYGQMNGELITPETIMREVTL